MTAALAVHVARVNLAVSDAAQAAAFFSGVLDFDAVDATSDLSHGGRLTVRLGEESLAFDERRPAGRSLPADSRSNDLWFQHIAIVVSDMAAAWERLRSHGVTLISVAPQRLPDWNQAAAGIQAVYFRGPDGHPLELITFPPGKGQDRWQSTERLFLGIDHTAIAVSSTEASLRFYRDGLGLDVTGSSENWGPEQERLSGVDGARVRITSLRGEGGPGVELLEYLVPTDGRPRPASWGPDDLWHVETVLTASELDRVAQRLASNLGDERRLSLLDPDGHAVSVTDRP